MQDRKAVPTLMIDALGGMCVAALIVAFVWMAFLRTDSPASRIKTLGGVVTHLRSDLLRLKAQREQQTSRVSSLYAELDTLGSVPQDVALDEYFHSLARLATEYDLQMRRQNPLTPRIYAGLLEQRYACEVAGTVTGIVRFLRSIEDSEVWADVSYLRINTERSSGPHTGARRVAQLTISLFTALPSESSSTGKQG